MRCLFRLLCVCALGVVPVVGCGETSPGLCEGVECEDDENECTEDVCNPADGTCRVPVGNGTACSGGACLDGVCTALTTVSGTVIVDEVAAAEGATVSWLGSTLSTTTDEWGAFSLELPIGNLFLQTSKAGTWGSIELFWTEGASELELDIESDESFEEHFPGIDLDATKGVVDITFNNHSGMGGESATLSANGMLMSDELPPGPWPWLAFANVDVTDELTVSPMGAEGVNTCVLQVPGTVYPVRAKFLTGVEVMCTPL